MKRKVIFVIDTLKKGGAENVLLQYVASMSSRYNIRVFVLKKISEYVFPHNIDVQFILSAEQKLTENIFQILYVLTEKAKESDIVIGFSDYFVNYVSILSAKLAGKPVMVSVRNMLSYELDRFELKDINSDLVGFSYKKADKILCVSNACKNDLICSFGLSEENMLVLRNPVDIKRFAVKAEIPADLAELFSGAPVVLAIGRLVKQKNFPFLLSVFSKIESNAKLCIVGKGQEYMDLLRYIDSLGISEKVHFLGHRDDIPALLQHSSMLLMASLYEGQPNVVLEAMAAGTVVVAPKIPAIEELIIPGYNGLLYKSDDENDACKQIEMVLANKNMVMGMANNAKSTVMAHDIAHASNALSHVINGLV